MSTIPEDVIERVWDAFIARTWDRTDNERLGVIAALEAAGYPDLFAENALLKTRVQQAEENNAEMFAAVLKLAQQAVEANAEIERLRTELADAGIVGSSEEDME